MMIVEVLFYKPLMDAYAGRRYAYKTNLDLKENDIVELPQVEIGKPKAKGLVVATHIPKELVPEEYKDSLKEITKYWE